MRDGPQSVWWLLFSFRGRIRRQSYALAAGLLLCINTYTFMNLAISANDSSSVVFWAFAFLGSIGCTMWSMLALSVKRLHDIGISGWVVLVSFIPGAAWLGFLALCFIPGEPDSNQFGGPPVAER
ncbi:MAG: DUF805 domain-containing protein [Pseudomonadota bacterium]